jgi:GT2 family glycosyltransferase
MCAHVPDIWLLDNGSPVDRLAEIASLFPDVRIVAMRENLGWAGAYNRGIALAAEEGADAVYILNNDAILREGALELALETLRTGSNIAAVGSVMLFHGGARVFFDGEWHWGDGIAIEDVPSGVRDVRSIHGGGFALSIAAFRAVGAFEPAYFLYHEEADWCLRARAAGWRIVMDGRSRVDHEGEGSNTGFNSSYYRARNRFLARRRGIALRDRPESALSIVEYEYLEAAGRPIAARVAITNGLIDGLRGRFGQRQGRTVPVITVPLAIVLPILFRLRRKLATALTRR